MLVKGFHEMTDVELKAAAVALAVQFEATGDELYERLAREALDVQERRLAATPNPYDVREVSEALFDRLAAETERANLARKRGYNAGYHAGRRTERARTRARQR